MALGTDPGAESLVHRTMRAVTDDIRAKRLKVGDALPGEGHYAAALAVSRPVVREAFGALAALRLIEIQNGRRPRVAALDASVFANSLDHAIATAQITVAEIWEVRRTIELRTAALAALHRTEAEAQAILDAARAMAASVEDPARMTGFDIAFHQAIAGASHNALFVQIVGSFAPLMAIAVPSAWATRAAIAERQTMIDRHRAVADAIGRQDPGIAAAAMEMHFDATIGASLQAVTASRHGPHD